MEATFDYDGHDTTFSTGEKDITIKKGQVCLLLDEQHSWSRVELQGQIGLVPSAYLQKVSFERILSDSSVIDFACSSGRFAHA